MAGMDVDRLSKERLKSKKAQGGSTTVKGDGTDFAATEREKLGSVGGKLGTGDADMPKQQPGEDFKAFGERMRQFRERKRATMDQAGSALANRR